MGLIFPFSIAPTSCFFLFMREPVNFLNRTDIRLASVFKYSQWTFWDSLFGLTLQEATDGENCFPRRAAPWISSRLCFVLLTTRKLCKKKGTLTLRINRVRSEGNLSAVPSPRKPACF